MCCKTLLCNINLDFRYYIYYNFEFLNIWHGAPFRVGALCKLLQIFRTSFLTIDCTEKKSALAESLSDHQGYRPAVERNITDPSCGPDLSASAFFTRIRYFGSNQFHYYIFFSQITCFSFSALSLFQIVVTVYTLK